MIQWLILGFVLTPLTGCLLAADVVNPAAWAAFGIDPATVAQPSGVILVAFNNTTRYNATFYAISLTDLDDILKGSRSFSAEIEAGETGNEVLECPVGAVSPGILYPDFSFSEVGATVDAGEAGLVDIPYVGPLLELGTAYSCGDVIEIRLTEQRSGEAQTFVVSLRVIPGQ
jgi:hypothetical protein